MLQARKNPARSCPARCSCTPGCTTQCSHQARGGPVGGRSEELGHTSPSPPSWWPGHAGRQRNKDRGPAPDPETRFQSQSGFARANAVSRSRKTGVPRRNRPEDPAVRPSQSAPSRRVIQPQRSPGFTPDETTFLRRRTSLEELVKDSRNQARATRRQRDRLAGVCRDRKLRHSGDGARRYSATKDDSNIHVAQAGIPSGPTLTRPSVGPGSADRTRCPRQNLENASRLRSKVIKIFFFFLLKVVQLFSSSSNSSSSSSSTSMSSISSSSSSSMSSSSSSKSSSSNSSSSSSSKSSSSRSPRRRFPRILRACLFFFVAGMSTRPTGVVRQTSRPASPRRQLGRRACRAVPDSPTWIRSSVPGSSSGRFRLTNALRMAEFALGANACSLRERSHSRSQGDASLSSIEISEIPTICGTPGAVAPARSKTSLHGGIDLHHANDLSGCGGAHDCFEKTDGIEGFLGRTAQGAPPRSAATKLPSIVWLGASSGMAAARSDRFVLPPEIGRWPAGGPLRRR